MGEPFISNFTFVGYVRMRLSALPHIGANCLGKQPGADWRPDSRPVAGDLKDRLVAEQK
jgi:hypothetical protein